MCERAQCSTHITQFMISSYPPPVFVDSVRTGILVMLQTSSSAAIVELARLTQRLNNLRNESQRLMGFQSTFVVRELGQLSEVRVNGVGDGGW